MKYFLIFVFAIVLLAVGPLLTIWSLNTLFPALDISYSLETWAAVVILGGVFKSSVKGNK
jgi:hypothetical protein